MKVRKEIWIGLFVMGTIVLFYWGFSFLKGKNIFGTSNYVWARYDRIDNLVASNPVFFKGFKVGQVSEVLFNPVTLKVDVKLILNQPIQIPLGSEARIISADLMGTKAVELIFSNSKGFLKQGDTLSTSVEESIKESFNRQLAPLQAKTERFLLSVDSLLTGMQEVFSKNSRIKLKSTLDALHNTILQLEQISYRTQSILSESNSHINATTQNLFLFSEQLKNQKEKLGSISDRLSAVSDSISRIHWNGMALKIQSDASRLEEVLKALQSKQGTMGKLVFEDSLYAAFNQLTINVNELVKDIKQNPDHYLHFSVFEKNKTKRSKSSKSK